MTRTKTTAEVIAQMEAEEAAAKLAKYKQAMAEGKTFHYPSVRTVAQAAAEEAAKPHIDYASLFAKEVAIRKELRGQALTDRAEALRRAMRGGRDDE
jgi:hypothetical protein